MNEDAIALLRKTNENQPFGTFTLVTNSMGITVSKCFKRKLIQPLRFMKYAKANLLFSTTISLVGTINQLFQI